METTLQNGDVAIDPFNILEVYDIQSDKDFNNLLNLLDIDKLIIQTIDCDVDDWLCKINLRTGEFLNFRNSDTLIRFAWWLTLKLLYERNSVCEPMLTSNLINIDEISKSQNLYKQLRLYIYKTVETSKEYSYNLNIMLPNAGQLIIRYKNNSKLC
jgi:hypothetical protein